MYESESLHDPVFAMLLTCTCIIALFTWHNTIILCCNASKSPCMVVAVVANYSSSTSGTDGGPGTYMLLVASLVAVILFRIGSDTFVDNHV